jgi:arsenate reductase (thioredoxin)
MQDTDVITDAVRGALRNAARDLHARFRGVFGEETIESLLLSSYQELAATATVHNWLVIGAERFARQRLEALAHAESRSAGKVPSVLFLCVHNAGRSQMALGWFTRLAGDKAVAWSAGSGPVAQVNPAAVAASPPPRPRAHPRPRGGAGPRPGDWPARR